MSTETASSHVKITKSVVDRLTPSSTTQRFVRDCELRGFAVRVTPKGVKSFVLEKRVMGRVRRLTLGRYPILTVEQARKKAQEYLGQIASGGDPSLQREAARRRNLTLAQAYDDYKQVRHNLSPRTLQQYDWFYTRLFAEWRNRPLASFTRELVAQHHSEMGEQHGKYLANCAFRALRGLFSFAIKHYEDVSGRPLIYRNPVDCLSDNHAWYPEHRRVSVIRPEQMPAWYEAVQKLKQEGTGTEKDTVADYLLTLLLAGLRRNEAAYMRWDNVDLDRGIITIPETKNGQPLVIPVSDFLKDLLERRRGIFESEYVFPGASGFGHLRNPYRIAKLVKEISEVPFLLHDLRRTFITTAERLNISLLAIKRLVNHRSGDVTVGYVVPDLERLRAVTQQITDFLLNAAGVLNPQRVVAFPGTVAAAVG